MSTPSISRTDKVSEIKELEDADSNFRRYAHSSSPKLKNNNFENGRICEARQTTQQFNFSNGQIFNCANSEQSAISACATPGAISENFNLIPIGSLPLYCKDPENSSNLKDRVYMSTHAQISKAFINQIPDLNTLNNVINEIIIGLRNENKDVSTQSVYSLYLILKDDSLRKQISYREFLINLLVKNFVFSVSESSLFRFSKLCAACLHYISLLQESACALYQIDLLSVFVSLPLDDNGVFLSYLISPVHTVFLHILESRQFLTNSIHLKKFVNFINFEHNHYQSILFECIFLCISCINVEFLIKETDFLNLSIKILFKEKHERLIFNICRIFKDISKNPSYKKDLLRGGIFNILISLLKPSSRRVAVLSLNIIKNLSEFVHYLSYNYEELIEILISFKKSQLQILGEGRFDNISCQLIACSLAILANITCNNSIIKEALIKVDAVKIISQVCSKTDVQEVLESAYLVLKHLTCRNSLKEVACLHFINSKGMEIVVEILQKCTKANISQTIILKKSLFGLLLNISSISSHLTIFSSLSVTQYVAHSLAAIIGVVYNEKNFEKHDKNKNRPLHQDYIKLLEYCVGIMYHLTSDTSTFLMMIKSNNLLCLFCKLLVCSSSTILAYVICFFSTLSNNENGLKALERAFKETQNQSATLDSRNKNICIERLGNIFNRLSTTNSKIYKFVKRLLSNLVNSQFKEDANSILLDDFRISVNNSEVVSYLDINSVIDSPVNVSPALSRVSSKL